jgi:hypothetical protein
MKDLETVTAPSAQPAGGPPATPPAERPAYIPEKFWDLEQGVARIEAMAKSYGELERKLGTRRAPETDAVQAGAPAPTPADEPSSPSGAEPSGDAPQPYRIEARHPLIAQDEALDARLQAAGFSEAQAQLVYDLAAERLLPMLEEMQGELEAQRHVDRLERHFGGPAAWRETARQLKAWSAAHLAGEAAAALSSSFEGVLALHQMMKASEPELLGDADQPPAELTEDALAQMMRDPRYWRKRDPDFVARVTAGFKKLYAL